MKTEIDLPGGTGVITNPWIKAARSGYNSTSVYIAKGLRSEGSNLTPANFIRDDAGGIANVAPQEFAVFLASAKAGRFDLPPVRPAQGPQRRTR